MSLTPDQVDRYSPPGSIIRLFRLKDGSTQEFFMRVQGAGWVNVVDDTDSYATAYAMLADLSSDLGIERIAVAVPVPQRIEAPKPLAPTLKLPVAGEDLLSYSGTIYAVIGVWADGVWLRSNGVSRIMHLSALIGCRYTNVENTIVGIPA